MMKGVICFWLSFISFAYGGEFGYISYSTYNIGDDIQALAAKRFLPEDPVPIDREFIGVFEHDNVLPTLVNGWYMHTKNFSRVRYGSKIPSKSWPPSSAIDPLLISMHFDEAFLPYVFSEESIRYLNAHSPVGARDLNTLKELQERGIPSYFSGCLCLTLENECTERENVIYAVDLDEECFKALQSQAHYRIVRVTHLIPRSVAASPEKRLSYAVDLLDKYKKAKAVVTGRLHATMPCIAFETPVLLINEYDDKRFHGLRELAHHCNRREFLKGQFSFDFDHPPQNPSQYLELKHSLIETVEAWVKSYQMATQEAG